MSSFFTVPASQRKRKRGEDVVGKARKRRGVEKNDRGDAAAADDSSHRKRSKPQDRERDESISGSESEDEIELESGEESEATSEEGENTADRRIRLAQRYLDNIKQEVDEAGFDAEDLDKDLIAQRLKQDVDEAKGRQFRLLATTLDFPNAAHSMFRADTESTTGVAVCQPYAYTVSRDKTLIKWELVHPGLPSSKKIPPPHGGKAQAVRIRSRHQD